MTIKSKLLKFASRSESNPEKWSDLSRQEKIQAGKLAATFLITSVGFSAAGYVAYKEVQNTPPGCTAVLFPEQTFIEQPKHCR